MSRTLLALSVLSLSAFHVGCGGSVNDETAQTQQPAAGGAAGSSASASVGGTTASGGASAKGGAAGAAASSGGTVTTAGKGGSAATGAGGAATGKGGTTAAGGAPAAGGADGVGGAGGSDPMGTGGSDAAGGAAGAPAFTTAPHPPYPKMSTGGAPVLKNVQLVTITYAGFAQKDNVEAYGDFIVQSEWLAAVGADYGIGKGAHIAKVVLPGPAPASISGGGIQQLLAQNVLNGTLPKPASAINDYLYMFYFPPTTVVSQGQPKPGGCAGQGFGGYHFYENVGGARLAYAVIVGCQGQEQMQISASHELIEAATDPNLKGYSFNYDEPWGAPAGGEVGDACNDLTWKEGGYTMQRSWSNSSGAAGQDPCVPVNPDLGAFGVSPSPAGVLSAAAGETVTVALTGWSEKPIGNFFLGTNEYGTNDFIVTPKFSTALINNGFYSNMTFTVPKTAPKQGIGSFFITSTYMNETHLWPIVIQVN